MALPVPDAPDDTAPFEYALHLPRDPRAVGVARTSLRAALTAHEVPELIDDAELLASEMLTNALRHSGGPAELRLRWACRTLRVSVWDTNPKPPGYRDVHPDSEHGRGLHMLHALADRWNHFPVHSDRFDALTKIIWCELDRKT